jgi:hypothetical protein
MPLPREPLARATARRARLREHAALELKKAKCRRSSSMTVGMSRPGFPLPDGFSMPFVTLRSRKVIGDSGLASI